MEAPSVLCQSAAKIMTRSSVCLHTRALQLTSSSIRQRSPRTQSRLTSSTARRRQDAPPQPQPVSEAEAITGGIDEPSLQHRQQQRQQRDIQRQQVQGASGPKPDPNNRIDLSALSNMSSSSYVPPARQTSAPMTASAKLDAMFGKPQQRPDRSLQDAFRRAVRQTDALDGTSSSSPSNPYEYIDFKNLFPSSSSDSFGAEPALQDPSARYPLRLRPTLGRTQNVDNTRGMDLTRAFRMLEVKCAANGVKRDFNKQRFHVRRGQRKKLERSLRWRTVFKTGFLEECARIRRMKNQGW